MPLLDYPYCGHMRYEMAGMPAQSLITIDKIKQLIEKTRAIAQEKDYKGGHFRIPLYCHRKIYKKHMIALRNRDQHCYPTAVVFIFSLLFCCTIIAAEPPTQQPATLPFQALLI